MNNSSSQKKVDKELAEEMPLKWQRGQDHFSRFTKLIRRELDDETTMVEERWKKWSKQRLLAAGLALFDLTGRTQGRFFGDPILVFENKSKSRLPIHRFGHGDIVLLSRARPWGEKVVEGIVLDRGPTRIRIVVSDKPSDIKKGTWRLDRGANRVAHDRMHEALTTFHSMESDSGTVLRDVLLGSLHDISASAQRPPEIRGQKRHGPLGIGKMQLNESQRSAVEAAIEQRLTLIQGPPGTGKTHTAIRLLAAFVRMGRGPILATAESNVAVDNLLEGLLELNINAVRIGRPVKVREHLRDATLDAQIENHPLQEELRFIREQNDDLRRSLSSLKGKEKGMAHRDVNRNFKEIRQLEGNMISAVLDGAEVICATTIGVGHSLLGERRFPVVLMDEATQASEPSALVPITRGCRQLVWLEITSNCPRPSSARLPKTEGSDVRCLNDSSNAAWRLTCLPRNIACIQPFGNTRVRDSTKVALTMGAVPRNAHLLQVSCGLIGTIRSPLSRLPGMKSSMRKAAANQISMKRVKSSPLSMTCLQQEI